MAVTQTPRFALPQWSSGTDSYPGRTGFNEILALLETKAAIAFPSGLLTNRPTGGTFGRFYLATDQGTDGRLYYDGGSGWIELNTNGGGGPGQPILIGGTASEGISNRSARADHTHVLPLATAANHGALSAQHYDMLDKATANVVDNAIVRRTSAGHIYLPPTGFGPWDAVTREYVDMKTGDTSGATAAVVGGAIVRRWSSGHVSGPDPDKPEFYTTKRYVDNKTWAAGDITSGTLSRHRVDGSIPAWNYVIGGTYSTLAVDSNGRFGKWSSSERGKTNIRPFEADPRELLKPGAYKFNRLNADGSVNPKVEIGTIAEWSAPYIPELVEYGPDQLDEDGNPVGGIKVQGWTYMTWTAVQQYLHQWQTGRVDLLEQENAELIQQNADLTERIEALEAAVAKLTA